MKKKNYEKDTLAIITCLIVFLLEIIFVAFLREYKMYNYKQISSIYVDDDNIMSFVDEEERKILYKNKYIYIDNKKLEYEIRKDNGVTINSNNKKYYEIYLKVKINKKYKLNDNINVVIKDKKINMLEMFKLVWVGDENS